MDNPQAKPIRSAQDIQLDPENANLGTERGREVVRESLRRYLAGRSVVVDRNGRMIAGEKTLGEWRDLFGDDSIQVVQSTGDRLLVHQRVDLDAEAGAADDYRAQGLGLADNRAGELGLHWDPQKIQLAEEGGLDLDWLWGQMERDDLFALLSDPPSLDDLADQFGETDERDFWPVIRVQVSPDTYDLYHSHLALIPKEIDEMDGMGNAMRLYLADSNDNNHRNAHAALAERGLRHRILLSYWYYKDKDLDQVMAQHFADPYPDIFADSGAFSAWSLGGNVDVHAYADWLHRWKHLFTTYANLDVKGDVDAGLRNLAALEAKGLAPLPVFHGGEPLSVLDDMVADYPYIALGGLAGAATASGSRQMWAFVVKCFQVAQGRSVFHGFGMTNWKLMRDLPWYSVDSSSWGQGFRYGQVPVFDEKRGRFVKLQLGDWKGCRQHASLVRSLGFDWQDFADRERNDRGKICALAALSYMLAERWLTRRHGPIAIPEGSHAMA